MLSFLFVSDLKKNAFGTGTSAAGDKSLLDNEIIQQIAAKAGMAPVQFLLSFVASLPDVVLLTKSQTLSRIQENARLRIPRFSEEVVTALEAFGIEHKQRTVNPDFFYAKKGDLFFKE